jgi:DNA (cytosine-5)-methyltransferase 1
MQRPDRARRPLTVGDLFCGAGGFSEGFEQAGFRIKWAVDSWEPAAKTFKQNHSTAQVLAEDVMGLSPRRARLSRVDVLIGSPPCVHFSPANRGGNGDRKAGMRLVRRFLWFVATLRPTYWVMENVPALEPEVRAAMRKYSLFPRGSRMPTPEIRVLNAALFGTPQSRKRLLIANFPLPSPSTERDGQKQVTLRDVLTPFPVPGRARPSRRVVHDPVYPEVKIPVRRLRDHLEDDRWRLSLDERRRARQQKQTHAVYGRMVYPDRLDAPSRTITATRTGGSRSTIVVRWPPGHRVYRTLTSRESASVQGFPITYQFWGGSLREKDRLVGNAVPPPLARAVAHSILQTEGRRPPAKPVLRMPVILAPPCPPVRKLRHLRVPAYRRFRGVVPLHEWTHDRRVELDNEPGIRRPAPADGRPGNVVWRARLYLGYAREYKCYQPNLDDAITLLDRIEKTEANILSAGPALRSLVVTALRACLNGFPTASELQGRWTGRRQRGIGPDRVVSLVRKWVEGAFPGSVWASIEVPLSITRDILRPRCKAKGKDIVRGQPMPLTVRSLAATMALTIACERLNRGTARLEELLHELLESQPAVRVDSGRPRRAPEVPTQSIQLAENPGCRLADTVNAAL